MSTGRLRLIIADRLEEVASALRSGEDVGDMFYASDGCGSVEIGHSLDGAISMAADCIPQHLNDEWSEDVDGVEWGVAITIETAVAVDVVHRQDDGCDYRCDYALRPMGASDEPPLIKIEPDDSGRAYLLQTLKGFVDASRDELARLSDAIDKINFDRQTGLMRLARRAGKLCIASVNAAVDGDVTIARIEVMR